MVRSGVIGLTGGRFWAIGNQGCIWASTAGIYTNSTTADAYDLRFDAKEVRPSASDNRWHGISLRCLAD